MLALWLVVLLPVYHATYGSWAISLAVPPPSLHFGLVGLLVGRAAGLVWWGCSLSGASPIVVGWGCVGRWAVEGCHGPHG